VIINRKTSVKKLFVKKILLCQNIIVNKFSVKNIIVNKFSVKNIIVNKFSVKKFKQYV